MTVEMVTIFDSIAPRSTAMSTSAVEIDTAGVVGVQIIGSNALDVPGTFTITRATPNEAALRLLAATVLRGRMTSVTFSTEEAGFGFPSAADIGLASTSPAFSAHVPASGSSARHMLGTGRLAFTFKANNHPPTDGTFWAAAQVTR